MPVSAKRIIFLTFPGAELLDLSGPLAVFNTASRLNQSRSYTCIVGSAKGGLVSHSCGTRMDTQETARIRFRSSDTVLVAGAAKDRITQAINQGGLLRALTRAAQRVERYGSICTGSFLLGACGLLDGKRSTTHWAGLKTHQRLFNNTCVDEHSLYVSDGRLWTSAGVTTGIDMALAMVEEDCGGAVRSQVAKLLVVYSHRPGNQSQFSDILIAQTRENERFLGLVDWLNQRINQPPQVEEMASYVNMSSRTFSRQFKEAFGQSPGKFLERMRMDRARELVESGELTKVVATKVGFASEASFRSAFRQAFGVTPTHYLRMTNKNN